MTELVEALFLYASETKIYPDVNTSNYKFYTHAIEKLEKSIEQLLPPDQVQLLEELRRYRHYSSCIEEEAAFRAGLSIGLELSRL